MREFFDSEWNDHNRNLSLTFFMEKSIMIAGLKASEKSENIPGNMYRLLKKKVKQI